MRKPYLMMAIRVSLIYVLFGAIWVMFSDYLISLFAHNADALTRLQTYKGWAFVVVTGFLIYILLRRELLRREQAEELLEKERKKQNLYLEEQVKIRTHEYIEVNQKLACEINERRMAEEALRESEHRYRKLVELSPDGIVVHCDRYIVFANQAIAKFVGLKSPEEMIGRNIVDFIHPDYQDIIFNRLQKVLEAGEAAPRIEAKFMTQDGRVIEGEAIAIPQTYQGRKAVQSVIRDITERKRLEREIINLERFNIIGEMAAGIAHEIRNPMTTVRGFLQLIRSKEDFTEYKEWFTLMIEELDRGNSIITEYLALAKNKNVELKKQSLNEVIEALFPLLEAMALNSEKQIIKKLGEIPDLYLNKEEIRQLLINLVKNGLDAMEGPGSLTIKTMVDKGEKEQTVTLVIEDQGKGIPSDVLEKIGIPFFTTKEDGTGLGLAICYSIADHHKATIDLQTGTTGTAFFVKFDV